MVLNHISGFQLMHIAGGSSYSAPSGLLYLGEFADPRLAPGVIHI